MAKRPRDPQLVLSELVATVDLHAVAVTPARLADGPDAVCWPARRYFRAAACWMATLDEDTDELVYVAASGAGESQVLGVRLPVSRGIAGWIAQSGPPLSVSDLSRDTRFAFARDVAESTNYIPTALLAIAVETAGRGIGVFSVSKRGSGCKPAGDGGDVAVGEVRQYPAASTLRDDGQHFGCLLWVVAVHE